ncbi:hypothetical protein N8346_01700 [Flavobacteriaceae bacterium]|nr:hypothetical protein [Flavobacteriaceae bacterium]
MSTSTIILIGALVFVIFIDFIIKKRKKNNLAIEIKVDQNPNSSFERNTIIGMFLINVFLALGLLNADYLDSKWNSFYLDLTASKIVEEEESFENFRMNFYKSKDIGKLNALIEKDPGFAEYYRLRGDYHNVIKNDSKKAIVDYSQALNLGTVDSAGVYFNRIQVRFNLGDSKGARKEWAKAFDIYEKKLLKDSLNPLLLYQFGKVYRAYESFYDNTSSSYDGRVRSYSTYMKTFSLLKKALENTDTDLMIINNYLGVEFSAFDLSRVKLKNLIYLRMMENYNVNVNATGRYRQNIRNGKGYDYIYNSELCNILRRAGEEGYSGPIDVYKFINKVCN